MEFLNQVEFTSEEIYYLSDNVPTIFYDAIVKQNKLVLANILYLKNQGIENYKEVFFKFYEIFLLDYSEFCAIFEKYDKEDLIKYLKNDVNVMEYL